MNNEDADYYEAQIRYLDTQLWLKEEIKAGRYSDPVRDLSEVLPSLELGEKPDPGQARPSLVEKPKPGLELAPNEVQLSDMDVRFCLRVAQARYDYMCAHQEEMEKYIETFLSPIPEK